MIKSIYLNSGTPQEIQNWSNPDRWIDDLLTGDEQELARRLWHASDRSLNPRYTKGVHLFLNKHELLSVDAGGAYALNEKGNAFLREDIRVIASIDYDEGIIHLLNTLRSEKIVSRQLLQERWEGFCLAYTNYRSVSSIADTLARRLKNLRARNLVQTSGRAQAITESGIEYLIGVPIDRIYTLDGFQIDAIATADDTHDDRGIE